MTTITDQLDGILACALQEIRTDCSVCGGRGVSPDAEATSDMEFDGTSFVMRTPAKPCDVCGGLGGRVHAPRPFDADVAGAVLSYAMRLILAARAQESFVAMNDGLDWVSDFMDRAAQAALRDPESVAALGELLGAPPRDSTPPSPSSSALSEDDLRDILGDDAPSTEDPGAPDA